MCFFIFCLKFLYSIFNLYKMTYHYRHFYVHNLWVVCVCLDQPLPWPFANQTFMYVCLSHLYLLSFESSLTMKFTIICVFLYQIQFSNSISCFQCSLISSNAVHTCPSSNQDISKWKDSKDKLITHVKNSNSDSFSCIVGIDKTKKVYYQVPTRLRFFPIII